MLSIALTKADHLAFTNAWREIGYGAGTQNAKFVDIWRVARKVYQNNPELWELAKATLFNK